MKPSTTQLKEQLRKAEHELQEGKRLLEHMRHVKENTPKNNGGGNSRFFINPPKPDKYIEFSKERCAKIDTGLELLSTSQLNEQQRPR